MNVKNVLNGQINPILRAHFPLLTLLRVSLNTGSFPKTVAGNRASLSPERAFNNIMNNLLSKKNDVPLHQMQIMAYKVNLKNLFFKDDVNGWCQT